MRRLLFAIASAGALWGCVLFTDLSGYTDGGADDASKPLERADAGDAAEAAPKPDGTAPPADAGVDARPCQAAHAFCIDFDDGKLELPTWSAISTDGTLVVESGPSVSAPDALHATLPARGDVNQVLRDRVLKQIDGPWRAAHLEIDVLVKTPAWGASDREMGILTLGLISDTASAGATFYVKPTSASAIGELAGEPEVEGAPFPYDVWTHVTIDADASHYHITYGADGTIDRTHATQTAGANPNTITFVGLSSYSDPVPAFDVRYDNVVLDFN